MPVIHAKYHLERRKIIFIARKNKAHQDWNTTLLVQQIWQKREDVKMYRCLHWGLNSGPLVYETSALPLSYRGLKNAKLLKICCKVKNGYDKPSGLYLINFDKNSHIILAMSIKNDPLQPKSIDQP